MNILNLYQITINRTLVELHQLFKSHYATGPSTSQIYKFRKFVEQGKGTNLVNIFMQSTNSIDRKHPRIASFLISVSTFF